MRVDDIYPFHSIIISKFLHQVFRHVRLAFFKNTILHSIGEVGKKDFNGMRPAVFYDLQDELKLYEALVGARRACVENNRPFTLKAAHISWYNRPMF